MKYTPALTRDALRTVDRRVKRAVDYMMTAFPAADAPMWVDMVHPKDVAAILTKLRDVQVDLEKLAEAVMKR